jgi:hypothetical protein
VIREFNDRGTLWLLEDPVHVRGVLQILEPDLAERLDFDRAERVNRSFIPADLQKRESDLIFRVPFTGDESSREVWVYVLLEHQSQPDPLMGLRLYLYMGHVWESQQRHWHDANLPAEERRLHPIIPLVFYTGTGTWSDPIGLASLMDLPAELERFIPRWETLFLNLHATPPETLTRFATAVGRALQVLQAEQAPLAELERVVADAMAGLEGLSEEQAGQWLRVAWFLVLLLYHRRTEGESASLIEQLREQASFSKFRLREEMYRMEPTYAEVLEQRGVARALRRALELVLTERFGALPADVRQRVAAAGSDQVETWLRIASRASTLDEVGILAQPPAG